MMETSGIAIAGQLAGRPLQLKLRRTIGNAVLRHRRFFRRFAEWIIRQCDGY